MQDRVDSGEDTTEVTKSPASAAVQADAQVCALRTYEVGPAPLQLTVNG